MNPFKLFMWGACAFGSLVVALFFFRFWRTGRDRLFAFFAIAFIILGIDWVLLAALMPTDENRHWVYAPRLFAFLLILIGIADKNRSRKS